MMIPCEILRSKRKTAVFSITRDGKLLLRIPLWVSDREAKQLIVDNQDRLAILSERWKAKQRNQPCYEDSDIPRLKTIASEKLPPRVNYWAERMGLSPTYLRITTAKGRFGSCNSRGGICFSCFLMLYPEEAIDYVIVHELAHLKHLNHSSAFYRLVEQTLPDYKRREAILKGK